MLAAVLGGPLLGAAASGGALAPLFRFPPPLEIPEDYPRFSWLACGLVVTAAGALVSPWLHWRAPRPMPDAGQGAPARFPIWGWIALAWILFWWRAAWVGRESLAWTRSYAFFPLWLGFIVAVNALALRRGGSCLMLRAPRRWLGLFAASAAFWWVFEWLNRFVRNWHYLGAGEFTALGYAAHATLCFSTVLPAVAAVAECLGTFPRLRTQFVGGPRWTLLGHRSTGAGLIVVALIALAGTGARPREFYPALWAAPLALVLGETSLARRAGLAEELARGDWRRAGTWMLAALVCGFFWELWNWRSFPKWIYTVPYVDRWRVFEMPLAGYVGYLPFGLECLLVIERVMGPAITRFPAAPPDRGDRPT